MFKFFGAIKDLVKLGAASYITDEEFIVKEINRFKMSQKRKLMLEGERYYEGNHDILQRNRTVIGQDDKLQTVDNLPNNRLIICKTI